MTDDLRGQAAQRAAFRAAIASGTMHHAWLLAGPRGLGKAAFARDMATELLSAAAGPGGETRTRAMIAAGSHPDLRVLERLPTKAPKGEEVDEAALARSIRTDQVRALMPVLATHPSMGAARAVIVDAIEDCELNAANALLKSLEEPPAGTVFLLVTHALGRLLPTIRSRCRLLRFDPLGDADVAGAMRAELPEAGEDEIAALVAAGAGSPGRALRFAGLDLAGIEIDLSAVAEGGDRDAAIRARLARTLSAKAAQARREAFFERVPAFIAGRAATRTGPALADALDAHAAAADLARATVAQSLDPATSVFELVGLVARLAPSGRSV